MFGGRKKPSVARELSRRASKMSAAYLLLLITYAEARSFCEKTKVPLEIGEWQYNLYHMDTATIENRPVSVTEGQVYVYENTFPNRTIKYIHVDNLAIRTCGANAVIKNGGINESSVLIVLHADTNQEIRSVIDIWGTKAVKNGRPKKLITSKEDLKALKSWYLFKELRAVNHNKGV